MRLWAAANPHAAAAAGFGSARIGPSRLRPRLRPRPVSACDPVSCRGVPRSPPRALDPRAYEIRPRIRPSLQSARRPPPAGTSTGASILRTIRDGASDSSVRTTVTTRVSRTRRRSGTARTPLGRLATGLFTRRGWTADRRGEAAGRARPRRSRVRVDARAPSRSRRGSDRARARCWWVPAGTVSARRPGDPARRGSTDAAAARSRSDPRLSSTRRAPAHVRAWLPIQSFAIRCGVSSPGRRSARPADAIPRRPPPRTSTAPISATRARRRAMLRHQILLRGRRAQERQVRMLDQHRAGNARLDAAWRCEVPDGFGAHETSSAAAFERAASR